MAVFACKPNRLYRIYVRPSELIFIWAGKGAEGVAGARATARRGGLHALIGGALAGALDPSKKNDARRKVLDSTPLQDLIGDHAHNLRAPIEGFEEVRICPRSDRHAGTYSDHRHQAILRMRNQKIGKFRLGIASLQDVQIAIKELPRVFGDTCRIEIPWPEQEQECNCRFCRFRR